jgi:DNA-binding MarR family transcriptional regulator
VSVAPATYEIANTSTPNRSTGVRTLARLARVAELACQSTGISLPQYRLLVAVSDASQRASELAERVGVSRPTLTSLVDGLERHQLLVRKRVPTDRRGVRLEPTAAGLEAVARAEAALNGRIGALINPEHADTANEIASAVRDNLDRAAS